MSAFCCNFRLRQVNDGALKSTAPMPAPTPPDKVLAAARKFAREKFAQHRYAMVLHIDQKHPHVQATPARMARGLRAVDA
ncbi:MAG: hypothetical protein ACLPV8_15225 [Steroidobacteraceae bacterium]